MCWNRKWACGKLEVNGLLQIQPRGEGRGKERGNFGSCVLQIWPVILKLWPRWHFYFEWVFIRVVHSRSLCSTLLEEIISSTLFNVRVRACFCLGLIGSVAIYHVGGIAWEYWWNCDVKLCEWTTQHSILSAAVFIFFLFVPKHH